MTLRVHPDEIVAQSKSPLLAVHDTWERVRIRDICEVKNGGAFRSSYFNAEGHGIPLIRIRDVGQKESKTYYTGEYKDDYVVVSDDLIVGMDGDFRCAVWKGQPALLNQRVCRLRVRTDEHYRKNFLSIVLQGYLDAVHAVTSAVTVKHLSSRTVLELPIPLPSLAEQERIVGRVTKIFTRLDTTESTMKSLLDKLTRLRSAILADAFHTTRHLPNGWKLVKLGQVCKKPQYGWTTKSTRTDGGVPYLRITDISSGSIDWASVPSCVELPKDIERFLLNDGDIVVSRAGFSVGVSHLLRDPPRAVFASYLIRLRANEDLIPEYLAFYLRSPAYWKSISENKIGTAIPNVNARKLANITIPVPSRLVQQDLIERVESDFSHLDTIEESVKNGLEQVATLRRSVLAEAFAGRLVPQDPADEPASVLLKRITASRPAKPKRRRRARV